MDHLYSWLEDTWRIHIQSSFQTSLVFTPYFNCPVLPQMTIPKCALGYQPPSKMASPFSCQALCPLNLKTVQAPFLGNPPLYWFIVNSHPPPSPPFYKFDFSMNPQNINVFHPLRCCKVINCGDGQVFQVWPYFEFINYYKATFFLSKNMSKFSYFLHQVKHVCFPLTCVRERDLKNIFYYQHDIENYTDQVLNFLLFDRHEYIHTESSGL